MLFSSNLNQGITPNRMAVKLNAKGEQFVLQGHPWVFSNNIVKMNVNAKSGDLAVIFSKNKNKVIGLGLYDANSPIRIKMLHSSYDKVEINTSFFNSKIQLAYKKRLPLLKTNTNSYRLLFGENDGFPGLIADVYAEVLVVKIYSEIWLPYIHNILPLLQNISKTKTSIIRLSRSLENSKNHTLKNGEVVFGVLKNEVVEFVEHDVKFSANVSIMVQKQ